MVDHSRYSVLHDKKLCWKIVCILITTKTRLNYSEKGVLKNYLTTRGVLEKLLKPVNENTAVALESTGVYSMRLINFLLSIRVKVMNP
ncbi:hypothetical protein CM19_00590 [Candidatus Acidianus copahuensis]|uniref:Uncharacterized protein n=1 Tax=Candidatus Acidianus copahuensis TaxID=1160895 RepID=A0A031LVD9_9CREN|nr:hypothetical protein CM19_00590 [Candidatus Acidianus copahuensis]